MKDWYAVFALVYSHVLPIHILGLGERGQYYITGYFFYKLGAKPRTLLWACMVYRIQTLASVFSSFSAVVPFPLLTPISHLNYVPANHMISHLIQSQPLQKVSFVPSSCLQAFPVHSTDMATTAAAFTPATITGAVVNFGSNIPKRTNKVVYIGGMSSYGGLKAHNTVLSLNTPVSTEQCFAKVVSSLRAAANGKGGGALFSKCNDVGEIFRIAAIMNGLVLVGVAVGFVLLRVEAWLEENE